MHMTRRAPELSATSRMVCLFIIDAPRPLSDALEFALKISCRLPGQAEPTSGSFALFAPDHGPALQLRDRLALLDPHHVARLELVVLVVRVVVFRAADRLLVDRMGEAAIDPQQDRIGLLVAGAPPMQG